MKKLIDAYIYREVSNEIEFLILQRAENRIYSGQWRMVGGKVKQNEEYAHAALREIEEEVQEARLRDGDGIRKMGTLRGGRHRI